MEGWLGARGRFYVTWVTAGLFLSLWFAQACGGPTHPLRPVCDTCRIVCGECEGQDRFVRLQGPPRNLRQDRQPNFSHPVQLRPEDWKVILASIRVQKQGQLILFFASPKGPVIEAFTPDEVQFLSRFLSQAFAQAQPTEWVVFGLRRVLASELPDEVSELTTGGWYLEGSNLHLMLANYRFAVTTRNIQELVLENPLSSQGLSYDLIPSEHQTVMRGKGLSWLKSTPLELSIAYQPLLLGELVSRPADGKSPTASPSASSLPSTMTLEERLQMLKRLREQGLITEENYQSKQRQLLDQF